MTNLTIIDKEESNFRQTLKKGVEHISKLSQEKSAEQITGEDLFTVYETYGFPFEMSIEELGLDEHSDRLGEEFGRAFEKHQETSRAGMEQKFKSGLADNSDIVVAYHTVAHLLLSATKKVLMGEGESIHQAGQNITADRLRYDMTFSRKIDGFELAKIEEQVNWWISKNLKVTFTDLSKEFALQIGAEALFKQKYDETVRVYFIYDPEVLSVELLESELDSLRKYFDRSGNIPAQLLENSKIGSMRSIVSKEFCAGPHVGVTQEISKFGSPKIVKEESSGSGVRRIKVQFE